MEQLHTAWGKISNGVKTGVSYVSRSSSSVGAAAAPSSSSVSSVPAGVLVTRQPRYLVSLYKVKFLGMGSSSLKFDFPFPLIKYSLRHVPAEAG
ncbi:hypothetical protein Dimus_002493, partial [Dionaea muscipula]